MKAIGTPVVMQGNAAAFEGALIAGCNFFAGYPITPATELAELAAQRLPEVGGDFIQMEDEIGSINALFGAAWSGRKVMTATSGPGFSLMQEGIGYAALTQTPCVIVNVQRGGPSAGQATISSQQDVMQARYGSHGDYEIIVLAPSSCQEALDLTLRAFNLAEEFLTPVIVLSDEIVGHTQERVIIPEAPQVINRRPPPKEHDYRPFAPVIENGGVPYRANIGEGHRILVEVQLHDEMGIRKGHIPKDSARCLNNICDKIRNNRDKIDDFETAYIDDATSIVVAYGSTARPALRAVKEARGAGKKVGFVKLKTLFPFPDSLLSDLARPGVSFFVPEMNIGKICREVRAATGSRVVSLAKIGGDMHTPMEILHGLGV